MARRLVDRGHQVTMVCGSYKGSDSGLSQAFVGGKRSGMVDGIEVIELSLPYANAMGLLKRTGLFVQFAWRGTWLALRRDYDLVFATSTPLTAGIPGIFARLLRRKSFVFEVRDLWPELPKAMGVIRNPLVLSAMSVLEWCSYHAAQRIIALSPGMARGIMKRGISEPRIALVPNGCDFSIFAGDAAPWRPSGVKQSDLLAVYSGTFGMANGLAAVLDAAVELQNRGREDIKIVLIGDGKLKQDLQRQADQDGINNVFFHDPVPKTKLAGLLKSADIGLQLLANVEAFYYGTSPNKFFDYIATGLPVLNNYPGWLADMIQRHHTGFAVPPEDAKAFADALEQAANDRQALKRMGTNAQALAADQFDRKALADRWVDVLESVLAQRKG